ncbi:hypothetical protein M011DRAFT_455227 [Sporormia fimetaria CBS 119925]|uniref:PH domain-containing protein n=1 Tax=Sporormia fimetaria CBS 119925 TaxID=1340428 RepID=A0A6A6VN63_9PLEO|nr:hypothetical protein M011DRAFT_455227 [Sporormia fimetaria CBS 119925]
MTTSAMADAADPFMSPHDAHRHRYSAFDKSQFSVYLDGSPEQAKRALAAHIAETNRLLQETSVTGKSLLEQKKDLEEMQREIEIREANNAKEEIGPELRQKLAELEKEYNEVGRETARAFLPRSRVPSGETDTGGGASVYASEAIHSPTKISVPSRKQRNQQPSRINDVALATEISTSLLSQLKELQAVLMEKDEALKAANLDRSHLALEVEGLSQRLRTLDDSESRLKDVNWNLETQVRELEANLKAAADRENRMNQTLNVVRSEKSTLERDFEEVAQKLSKLSEEHAAKVKHHEADIQSMRRTAAVADTERTAMQRKIDDLATQNQELARAVAYRMRAEEHVTSDDTSPDDAPEEGDTITPDHSPPVSPSKPTPRHGQLESETLKHSLNHAHRMIQQLKNNIHREKTEKLELKRMLQDARDELETNRNSAHVGSASKRRKQDKDVFKKPPRPDRLGAFRTTSQEVISDDDWEDQSMLPNTPSRRPPRNLERVPGAFPSGFNSSVDTGTETSDAFETANEQDGTATETDAFQTGAETLDGDSSDDLTETEGGGGTIRAARSPLAYIGSRDSFQSTESMSGDDDTDREMRTPSQREHPRYKMKTRQPSYRRSTPRANQEFDSPSTVRDSPSSFVNDSNNSTPAQGKSLFAELGGFDDESEDGSFAEGTPSRSSLLSPESSPEARRKPSLAPSPLQAVTMPRPIMVDSETMTDPMEPEGFRNLTISSVSSHRTDPVAPRLPPLHLSSLATLNTEPWVVPAPRLDRSTHLSQDTAPRLLLPASLQVSNVAAQDTLPVNPTPPVVGFSSLAVQSTAPVRPLPPAVGLSSVAAQTTAPVLPSIPAIGLSSLSTQATAPVLPLPASLSLSNVGEQDTWPVFPSPPSLNFSSVTEQGTKPVHGTPQSLDVSSIADQTTEPRSKTVPAPVLSLGVSSLATEPLQPSQDTPLQENGALNAAPVAPLPPTLRLSSLSSQATGPRSGHRQQPQRSMIQAQTTEPTAPARPPRSRFSRVFGQTTAPVEPRKPAPQISSVLAQDTAPVAPPKPRAFKLSRHVFQTTKPVDPPRPAAPTLAMQGSQHTEPAEPARPTLGLAIPHSLSTEPVEGARSVTELSTIIAQETSPRELPHVVRPENRFSGVHVLHDVQPESPTLPAFLPSPSRPSTANRMPPPGPSLSLVSSQETEPRVPSRPVTAHRDVPLPSVSPATQIEEQNTNPVTSKFGFFNAVLPWSNNGSERERTAAEDDRAPLTPVVANASPATHSETPVEVTKPVLVDEGTQTMVSAEQIDRLLTSRYAQRNTQPLATAGIERAMSPPSSPRKGSYDQPKQVRRPSSASSMRSRATSPPPLPADHKEIIAAASLRAPSVTSEMGPPLMPASAYKKRPETPTLKPNTLVTPKTTGTTPRPKYQPTRSDQARSGASSPITHRSSVSSFRSEIDRSFNPMAGVFPPQSGLDNITDPRMIQAITQTMIGEFLWKYTRKAGREDMSENRHRRFFWLHPYNRTLYWSDLDPAMAGRNQVKSKSVAVESVSQVVDDNPYPPGLHNKSIVVLTQGRTVKFTATTGQRHETWFNALSYLLRPTDDTTDHNADQTKDYLTTPEEIQTEFNPAFRSVSRQSRATERSRASSYFSQATTSSPLRTQIPTLRHPKTPHKQQRAPSVEPPPESGRLSSLGGFLGRPGSALRNSFQSMRSRSGASQSHDTTVYEQRDRDEDFELAQQLVEESVVPGLENVRACCDGKHDVGHLHTHTPKGRHFSYTKKSSRTSIAAPSVSERSFSRAESRASNPPSRSQSRQTRHE